MPSFKISSESTPPRPRAQETKSEPQTPHLEQVLAFQKRFSMPGRDSDYFSSFVSGNLEDSRLMYDAEQETIPWEKTGSRFEWTCEDEKMQSTSKSLEDSLGTGDSSHVFRNNSIHRQIDVPRVHVRKSASTPEFILHRRHGDFFRSRSTPIIPGQGEVVSGTMKTFTGESLVESPFSLESIRFAHPYEIEWCTTSSIIFNGSWDSLGSINHYEPSATPTNQEALDRTATDFPGHSIVANTRRTRLSTFIGKMPRGILASVKKKCGRKNAYCLSTSLIDENETETSHFCHDPTSFLDRLRWRKARKPTVKLHG